jgi:hypothetical protein
VVRRRARRRRGDLEEVDRRDVPRRARHRDGEE